MMRNLDTTPNLSRVIRKRMYKDDLQKYLPSKADFAMQALQTQRNFASTNELKLPKRMDHSIN